MSLTKYKKIEPQRQSGSTQKWIDMRTFLADLDREPLVKTIFLAENSWLAVCASSEG